MAGETAFDQQEVAEFRRNRTNTTFKAVLYGGIATSCFFGVMAKLVDIGVKSVQNLSAQSALSGTQAAGAAASAGAEAAALSSLSWPTMLVMGAVMAVGAVFTYLAQREWTETKLMEDDHLARKNAQCMGVNHQPQIERAQAQTRGHAPQEFNNEPRKDGKPWTQVAHESKHGGMQHEANTR